MAAGTLSGTITDAANGALPVYPVHIALIDPESGDDPPDLDVMNNADGSYQITDIPAGSYKVHFNAGSEANGYVDELYNDIPCDNGGCGMDVLGDVVVIGEEEIFLDTELQRVFLLSGVVTNDSATPLASVLLEVFDESGSYVCCGGTTDETGLWSQAVPSAGNYYVRTVGYSAPGYVAEVWDDKTCDDCDGASHGQTS